MVLKYLVCLLTLFTILSTSCSKDDEYEDEEITIEIEEPSEAEADLVVGTVTDFDDLPIANAMVTLSNGSTTEKTTFTDDLGKYTINTSGLEATKKILTIQKDGFLTVFKQIEIGPSQEVSTKLASRVCSFTSEDYTNPDLDLDIPMITLSGRAFYENGEGARNSQISVVNANYLDPGGVIIFSNTVPILPDGSWESLIPKDMEMQILVDGLYQYDRDKIIEVGPFSEDVQVDDITELTQTWLQLIRAEIPTCNNQDLEEGTINHFRNGHHVFLGSSPYFDGLVWNFGVELNSDKYEKCQLLRDPSITNEILVYDYPTNQYGLESRPFEDVLDFGKIEACTILESSYDLTLDGEEIKVEKPNYIQRFLHRPTNQEGFSIVNFHNVEDGKLYLRAHIRDEIAVNQSYSNFVDVLIFSHNEPKTYANFEGTITINEIRDGYVFGNINGTIYPSNQEWFGTEHSIDGPAMSLAGTFKSLLIKE